jgi:hypothetical protein
MRRFVNNSAAAFSLSAFFIKPGSVFVLSLRWSWQAIEKRALDECLCLCVQYNNFAAYFTEQSILA